MEFFSNLSTVVSVGPIRITWYAVMILIGASATYALSLSNFKKMGYTSALFDDLFVGTLISGIIGTRIWYVLFQDLNRYLADPLAILRTWEGGLAIQGGILFGALYVFWFTRKKKLSFLRMADAIMPNVLVAQAIGRWGNFFNQEAYGRVVSESYYALFPEWFKNIMFIQGFYREPTFLYESVLNLLGFFLIVFVLKRYRDNKRGDMVYAYLMWYGLIRFIIEGFRSDSLMFMGIRTAQVVSIVFIVLGVLGHLGVFDRFMPKKKPVILFDFDGTLADTEPMIIETYRQVLRKYVPDLILSSGEEFTFNGPTLRQTLGRYIREDQLDEAIVEYRAINKKLHEDMIQPMPNAIELLERLKAKGYRIGLVSSKKKEMVEYGLKLTRLEGYFETIIGYDDVKEHKPHPEGLFLACEKMGIDHDNVIYVGDTHLDILAADAAGMFAVALMHHDGRLDDITASKPNAMIRDLLELEDVLTREITWTRSLT
jgi:phosphatidylglycerol---prolipoprotein diacylglyceryl transferase